MPKKSFILHDETLNTHGFRMLTDGADLTEFLKNPVMLYNHDDWSLPIGRWENIRKEDGKILADPVFDLKDDRGKQVSQKVADDFLRAASIGAWPPTELSDAPEHMLPGQKHPTVTKWKVREASIVTIGGNHNALVFYDHKGNKMDLKDPSQLIKLFDLQEPTKNKMSVLLNKMLNLADNAPENEREQAVQALINRNVELTDNNTELTRRLEEFRQVEKTKEKAKAISLTDEAIKDGRINADAREHFIKLFDSDFGQAKAILEGLPKRPSVTQQIEQQQKTELSDMQKASWDELDKSGRLVMLKDKHPDLYAEKFEKKFGKKP
ncbi:HK97 family phage prohead protease [Alkaliflexus imshenetskii]|uniref:hypothetical protein n=1 Tax=Alkaliflexus imshenetskii TaxID=286730 RepID=UPI00047D7761|nr:hypothetical protein [Alkaliflexus imshenetskii]